MAEISRRPDKPPNVLNGLMATLLAALLLAYAPPAHGQTAYLDCTADKDLWSSNPDSAGSGSAAALTAGLDYPLASPTEIVSLLKFGLSELPSPVDATVTNAMLYIYCGTVSWGSPTQLQVWHYPWSWSESTLTYNQFWAAGPGQGGGETTAIPGWAIFNVTDLVAGWWQSGNSSISLAILPAADDPVPGWAIFYSSEYYTEQLRPYLRVTYTVIAEDCNNNGIDDACDIDCGDECDPNLPCGESSDCQGDGIPDECQLLGNDDDGNGVPDDCQPEVPTPPGDQPAPSSTVPDTITVTIDRLQQWDGAQFQPGPVQIDPDNVTYLLGHGWDGHPSGLTEVAEAIQTRLAQQQSAANILAWDWHEAANPNGIDDFPSLDIVAFELLTYFPWGAVVKVSTSWVDAWISGQHARSEGNALGLALAFQPSLGRELHLIGHSHGGGLLGQAARVLQWSPVRANSLTTLDTPRIGGIDSLQYLLPSSVDRAAVFYYPQLGGCGMPRGDGATDIALNSEWVTFPSHLSVKHVWYPAAVILPVQFEGSAFEGTALDVPGFPAGAYEEEGFGCFRHMAGRGDESRDSSSIGDMELLWLEDFETAETWAGHSAIHATKADPLAPDNRLVVLREEGDAWVFRDVPWPDESQVLVFDYMFRAPRGTESLTAYVNGAIVYYDSARVSLASEHLTSSGELYVGNVAGTTARLSFVLRSDSESGGAALIDNICVYGYREFSDAISRPLTVINRTGDTPTFAEGISNCWTLLNRAGDEPEFNEGISRLWTLINRPGSEPEFDENISRGWTACNAIGAVDEDSDGWHDCLDNCPDHANPEQADCDEDGFGDVCAIAYGLSEDCNANSVPDNCDIAFGTSGDFDANGIPDECEIPADVDGDGDVDIYDFLILADCLTGPDVEYLPDCIVSDLDADGDVDLADFALFQAAFAGSGG